MNSVCVITTINPPTPAVTAWAERFRDRLLIIGDHKTPATWQQDGADFYSLDRQQKLPLASATLIPTNHYARKNIGYLEAMRLGARVIYDTDDDNAPTAVWYERGVECEAKGVTRSGWCNIYRLFGQIDMWPRGFSLQDIRAPVPTTSEAGMYRCPIQQGLADGDPDVDAIWRLTRQGDDGVLFRKKHSVVLRGAWCPFNSQSTWWWPEAYPLLYLPIHAPFRMTDIWRSFVAQRCLWMRGLYVAFHSPSEVEQKRNPHNYLADFKDEIPGYLQNHEIANALEGTYLDPAASMGVHLLTCYKALVAIDVLPDDELTAVRAWLHDVEAVA